MWSTSYGAYLKYQSNPSDGLGDEYAAGQTIRQMKQLSQLGILSFST
jgi:hypothetical protein